MTQASDSMWFVATWAREQATQLVGRALYTGSRRNFRLCSDQSGFSRWNYLTMASGPRSSSGAAVSVYRNSGEILQ